MYKTERNDEWKKRLHAVCLLTRDPHHDTASPRLPPFATEQSARLQKENFTQLEDALLALNMERSQVCSQKYMHVVHWPASVLFPLSI